MASIATCANVAQALADAKAYTDQEITALETYVDAQDADTLADAKAYTDQEVDALKVYVDAQDAATLAAAKSYSDGKLTTAVEAIDERLDALELHPPVEATRTVLGHVKLATAETYPVLGGASDELAATPAYVDAAIAAQVNALVTAALANLTDAFGS